MKTLLTQLEWKIDHLTSEQQEDLVNLLVEYSDVFAFDASELGTTDVAKHHIDSQSIRHPYAGHLLPCVEEMILDMLS